MAGYGNRTAPDFEETDEHSSTRLGLHDSHHAYSNPHDKYGSGATGGAGFGTLPLLHFFSISPIFYSSVSHTINHERSRTTNCSRGNKSSADPSVETTEEFRFGSHSDTSPYSGASEAGSGSTAGAGYGNKTGDFGSGSGGTSYFFSLGVVCGRYCK